VKLSILIPVYNEQYTIEQVIDEVRTSPLPAGVEREIVVVNDASTDGTSAALERIKASHPEIVVLQQERNQGKGAAIRRAIHAAKGDVLVIQDADLEYNPKEFCTMLAPILDGEADVVYGSRFVTHGCRRILYFWHSVGNRFLTMLSNLLTDLDLTDMETCYKMARAEILKSIPIRCNRFGIEPELTAKLAKRGCRIYEVPISYHGRTYEEGKKITWKDGLKALFVMLYYRLVDDLYDEEHDRATLWRMSETHRFNRWLADAIRPWIGDRVLELGAGMGHLTRRLVPRQQYVAAERDDLQLAYLANVFARNRRMCVTRTDPEKEEDFAVHAGRFDTVVCVNVLEHVKDDLAGMRNVYSALEPGGRACILVPQHPSLYCALDEVMGRRRRYTREELDSKLRQAGFDVERVFSFNRITRPGWWLNGKVLKRRHFGKIQLKAFDSLVWLWRRVDRFLPWEGVSLVAIARRPQGAPTGPGHCSTLKNGWQ
jgi:glycosyltransferase involved in cell wall biosynthesis